MKRRTFVTAASAVTVGTLSGCAAPTGENGTEAKEQNGGAEDGQTTTETTAEGTTTGQGGQGGATQVQMLTQGSEYLFDPVGLFVEPGDTVNWVIESGAHSSTAYASSLDAANTTRIPENAEPWNSGILTEQGASFSYTFEVTGTYDYFCIPHKTLGMVARIVCGEPGGVEGDPPDGPVPAEQAIVDQGAISPDEFEPTTTDGGG